MVRYDEDAEFRLIYAEYQEGMKTNFSCGIPDDDVSQVDSDDNISPVDVEDVVSPVDVGADDDATAAVADDYGTTFVYTEGAEVPNDVVRLRVDPTVERISPRACMGRKKLIEVIFPEGKLRAIGMRAFAHCTALRGVLRLPNSLMRIEQHAFECCTSLTKVTYREDLENSRHAAFRGCAPTLLLQRVGRKAGTNAVLINLRELRRPTEEEVRTMGIVYHPRALPVVVNGFQYDVGPDDTLKSMFNTFCTQRGVTLRSLKLIYKDKIVFPSNIKHKTPKQLGMQKDHDNCIIVYVESNEDQRISASVRPQVKQQRGKTKKRSKRVGSASKVKKERIKNKDEPAVSIEDYKRLHSMILTRLHEEVQPRLSDIRTKLNALDLQRQPPKSRSICSEKCMKEVPNDQTLPGDGIGGKAGKSYFVVQVGEVENLYKTTKPSSSLAPSLRQGQSSVPTLDLHGCTMEEAILRLNESLKVWVDTAMKGYHPFVITVVIVCGCGSQVLMETVREWIKSTSQVRNAPKK
jgi:hypothetical protein